MQKKQKKPRKTPQLTIYTIYKNSSRLTTTAVAKAINNTQHKSMHSQKTATTLNTWQNVTSQRKYTVTQKKLSHFYFRYYFAICWDMFTIFEALCS